MTEEFKQWMADHKLTPEKVADAFGIGVQTVYNWRSSGIPPRRLTHVRKLMDEWESRQRAATELGKLILRPTEDQFRAWNRAAITGQARMIEDWALDVLDEAARTDIRELPRVAEDESPFNHRSGE